ncbi:MAG: hypothetical protein ACR2QM_11235 [Longimicrobiales bacterium]
MRKWLRRIRGAIGMGLTWAAGWTVAGMLGAIVIYTLFPSLPEPDILIPVFAYPGFLAGVGFSVVLRIADGRRRFDELSLPRFAAWGALGGLLVGTLVALVASQAAPVGVLAAIMGSSTLLGAGSASGLLAVARRQDDRELLSASEDVVEVGLTGNESEELLAPSRAKIPGS